MILLTGATGFLGQFVLQELLDQGFEITALTRAHNNITKRYPDVNWIKADLSKPGLLKKIPPPSDGIVHLASTLSIRPNTMLNVDVKGMLALLEIWNKGPFIFISSTDVYGPLRKIPADEEHPLMPSNWYGFGKSICEQTLQFSGRMKGNDNFVIFRAPYILGPHQKFQTSLIGTIITLAMTGRDFILPKECNTGERLFGHSWVNALDISCWIASALRNGPSGAYNAASGFFTWEELLELIIDLTHSTSSIIYSKNDDMTLGLCAEERRFSTDKLKQAYNIQGSRFLREILIEIISEINSQTTGGLQNFF
ncbi:MAG: NAD(P)-dependent oxidoreductase [Spirochaetota bacterium]|nr:NAD(P)-dependent oxidoreductase [Spirochaetota bacterium]